MKKHTAAVILLLTLLLVLSAAGCSKKSSGGNAQSGALSGLSGSLSAAGIKESRYRGKIEDLSEAKNLNTSTSSGQTVLTAKVSLPPVQKLMEEFLAEADEKAKSESDFEDKLLKLVLDAAKDDDTSFISRTVTVDLSTIDPDKTDWDEDELAEIAVEQAVENEIENFCMSIIDQNAPAFKTEDE